MDRVARRTLQVYQVTPWFGMPFTVLIVVYVTNAINLIDGIDGLASGLCAISLVALAGLHVWLHLFSFALLCIAALGVIIPFWFYNVFGNAMRAGSSLWAIRVRCRWATSSVS